MEIKQCRIDTAALAYHVFGTGKIDLVIEMGLGAVMGEWWQLAGRISENHTVLLYERAGCGSSGTSTLERTPENICRELHQLLEMLGHEEQVTLLAHSQGGLYARQFAQMYPDLICKVVLLDPLSPQDSRFRTELSEREFKVSGADKTDGLRLNLRLTRMHLGWLVRKVMRSAPPFYYYRGFSEDETRYILNAISTPRIYETALEEYAQAHHARIAEQMPAERFPQVPLVLVTHDSDIEMQEICDFGRATREEAAVVESLWQEIMCEYLSCSADSKWIRAPRSSHYIHLTDADLVCGLLA